MNAPHSSTDPTNSSFVFFPSGAVYSTRLSLAVCSAERFAGISTSPPSSAKPTS